VKMKTGLDSKIAEAAPYCEGPDPSVRTPSLKVPLGATDTHFHILGPRASYAYVREREYTPPDALPSQCQRMFDALGVQRAVLIQPSVYGEDNRRMEDAARELQTPTRMIVVVPLDIGDKELQRLHDLGARGIRFILAHVGGLPISDLEGLSDRARHMGWHIQFLLRPAHIIELEPRIARLSTDFVIDHIGLIRPAEGGVGQPAFQALLRLFRTGRCWIKLTGGYRFSSMEPPYPDVIPLVEALVKERPDRLLWGTDWPHVALKGKMPNTTDLLDLLLNWIPDEEVRKQVLATNPQTLFRF
jgi:predicted TIM-barrel fold metal-dependent hydrolase